ncbi:MAG: DedA family protein [Bacteroidetes bacterium]|nr:DedA family protein [Bacteroidota bacterium]
MEYLRYAVDFVIHIDKHLFEIVSQYQTWTYLILFVIVFCETGLVVTPFLPGDSLLFAAGGIAAMEGHPLDIKIVIMTFMLAAFVGDNTNYFLGRFLGKTVYEKNYRLIRRDYLDKTSLFYEKHGGITVIIARFMPIIRTFAPFVAGVGKMKYRKFITFSIGGSFLWTILFCLAGYFFGNITFVRNNFSIVILVLILMSLLPPVIAVIREKLKKKPVN